MKTRSLLVLAAPLLGAATSLPAQIMVRQVERPQAAAPVAPTAPAATPQTSLLRDVRRLLAEVDRQADLSEAQKLLVRRVVQEAAAKLTQREVFVLEDSTSGASPVRIREVAPLPAVPVKAAVPAKQKEVEKPQNELTALEHELKVLRLQFEIERARAALEKERKNKLSPEPMPQDAQATIDKLRAEVKELRILLERLGARAHAPQAAGPSGPLKVGPGGSTGGK